MRFDLSTDVTYNSHWRVTIKKNPKPHKTVFREEIKAKSLKFLLLDTSALTVHKKLLFLLQKGLVEEEGTAMNKN